MSDHHRYVKTYTTVEEACSNSNPQSTYCPFGYMINSIIKCEDESRVCEISYAFDPDGTGPIMARAISRQEHAALGIHKDSGEVMIYETIREACEGKKYSLYRKERILEGGFVIQCNDIIVKQAYLIDVFNGQEQVIPFGFLTR